jgi:Tfp pilus assembly major pilin PilA
MRSHFTSVIDRPVPRRQRGLTLFGLMFWAIVVGAIAYVGLRVFPTVNEYLTIKRTIEKVAASSPATVAEVRAAFERQKDIEYSISSISGKDLEVTKENEKIVIAFAYDKEIPLYGSVYLLIKYEGRSSSR